MKSLADLLTLPVSCGHHSPPEVNPVELWEQGLRHAGRPPIYSTPQELLTACESYFQWSVENPLKEEKAFCSEGRISIAKISKLRAFTTGALCLYIGMTLETWCQYRKKPGFSEVTSAVDEIIRTQKFHGAAGGLLNPVIIARDLGLRETVDNLSSDGSMTPKSSAIDASKLSDAALAEIMAARRSSP